MQVAALDHALQEMRRVVMRPPTSAVPMPLLGRPVDLSKVLACEALAELQKSSAVSITDLAFAMHLEDEGLIARGSDPEDGRRVTVCLTPLGTQVVTFVQGLRVGYLNHATEVFTGEELTQLASLVGRLAHSMTESFGPWLDEAVRQSTPGAPNA